LFNEFSWIDDSFAFASNQLEHEKFLKTRAQALARAESKQKDLATQVKRVEVRAELIAKQREEQAVQRR
jgi:hypothetical protein